MYTEASKVQARVETDQATDHIQLRFLELGKKCLAVT